MLFDVDGTLVDSNLAHAHAWHDAFAEEGLEGGDVERIRRLIGMGSDKLLPTAVGIEKDSPQGERLAKRRSEVFKERYLPQVRGFPRAHDLVEASPSAAWSWVSRPARSPTSSARCCASSIASGSRSTPHPPRT